VRNSLTGVVVVLVACLAAVAWAADTQPTPKTGTITSVEAAAKTFVLTRDPILKERPLTFTVDDKTNIYSGREELDVCRGGQGGPRGHGDLHAQRRHAYGHEGGSEYVATLKK
jgi:hypothetical protein